MIRLSSNTKRRLVVAPKNTGGEVLGVPTSIGKHRRGRPGRAGWGRLSGADWETGTETRWGVARSQAGVLLRRLKLALPGWAQAERRRTEWRDQAAQWAAQARAYSGEGHSEEWRFEFPRPYPH